MPDTYGYNEDGTKKYDPGKYDQWGVYMGSRGADKKAAKVGAMQNSSLWESDLPFEEWLPQYAATMLARNSQGGLSPVTAAQGTQEYRDQIAKNQEDARIIAGWGGTTGNMGVHNQKGAGLNMFNQYKDRVAGQIDDWARARALKAYNNRAEMAKRLHPDAEQGLGTGLADNPASEGQIGFYGNYSNPQSGGWGGFYNNPASSAMSAPSTSPAPLATPTQSPVATPDAALSPTGPLGSSPAGPATSSTGSMGTGGFMGGAAIGGASPIPANKNPGGMIGKYQRKRRGGYTTPRAGAQNTGIMGGQPGAPVPIMNSGMGSGLV